MSDRRLVVKVSTIDEDKICRICHDNATSDLNPLICPCKCSGTIKYVHRDCLNSWRHSHPMNHEHFTHCPICHYAYVIKEVNKAERRVKRAVLVLFYCLMIFLGFSVFIFCGFVGKSTCMGLVRIQLKRFQDLMLETEKKRVSIRDYSIYERESPKICPSVKARSQTDLFFSCNMKREIMSKRSDSPVVAVVVSANDSNVEDCYDIWQKNVNNLKLWVKLWDANYYAINSIHLLMGAITLSFFGIFHLVVFWRAYFDFYLSSIATDKHGINTHQMIFVSFSSIETCLFTIFVVIGLIKSAIIMHKIMTTTRDKLKLTASNMDDDIVVSMA